MTTAEIQTLLDATNCYGCYGLSVAQRLELGLYRQWLLSIDPNADTTAAALLASVNCVGCFEMSLFDLLEIAFLGLISAAS